MIQTKLSIESNERLNKSCWRMALKGFPSELSIKPGQFINIKILPGTDPYFRRPFSVYGRHQRGASSQIDIVYEVVGRGTTYMSQLHKGDEVDIIGPLGHGFEKEPDKKVHIIIGGGIGCAGIHLFAQEMAQEAGKNGMDLYTILDFKAGDRIILEEDFKKIKGNMLMCTHDGSKGYHGYVTKMLKEYFEAGKFNPADCAIYACGPELMYKQLTPLCQQYGIQAQVSVEKHMMCGMGACLACVCKVDRQGTQKYRDMKKSHIQFADNVEYGYALTCKDGPVFHIDEVIFDE